MCTPMYMIASTGEYRRNTLNFIQFNFISINRTNTFKKTHKLEDMQLNAKAWGMLQPIYN